MKVLFCASEVTPLAKTGGLADVCGTLPVNLRALGVDVAIVMPYYRSIIEADIVIKKLSRDIHLTYLQGDIPVYLIENDVFFNRKGIYGTDKGDYEDNLERFQFFCRRTLELIKELNLHVDILHCHDWQTALMPVYLKTTLSQDRFYNSIKTLFSIHNLAFQGVFPKEKFKQLGLPKKLFSPNGFEFFGKVNLLKGALIFSDKISTVSPTYAKEIQTKEYGCGLEDMLKQRNEDLIGILNGVDYTYWNPKTDPLIYAPYTSEDLKGKEDNKKKLQEFLGLHLKDEVPLCGYVGRLSHQKGLDLIHQTIAQIMPLNIQCVFLGLGEEKYVSMLFQWKKDFPGKVAVNIAFDESLAHKIYAASDIFLMPSVFEPCGLSQLISLKYGTIPVVHKTGGLADTIFDEEEEAEHANGFTFSVYERTNFIDAVKRAVRTFHKKERWYQLMANGFKMDYSWTTSAQEYLNVYKEIVEEG